MTTAPADIAAHIARTIDDIFAIIDRWRDLTQTRLHSGMPLTAASLDPFIESFAAPAITGGTLLTGAGFVAGPGVLPDAPWHLAWWLGGPGRALRRLSTIEDPRHEQFRDYTALEWWRVPAETGARHVTGPYVDYVCTDDYTVTVTTPVIVDGALVGMVGADALVDRLEREILPALRAAAGQATLVNASGRVVTSTDTGREPGSVLHGLDDALRSAADGPVTLPDGTTVHACGDTSLSLLVH